MLSEVCVEVEGGEGFCFAVGEGVVWDRGVGVDGGGRDGRIVGAGAGGGRFGVAGLLGVLSASWSGRG